MKFIPLRIVGAFLIELKVFEDARGSFARTFCKNSFKEILPKGIEFVQINHSITLNKGTIRGMHYQEFPHLEDKLIRCVNGKVYDVLVDLRKTSPTYLKWEAVTLSKENKYMVFIPKGCAHGFQSLMNATELIYHHSAYYAPQSDRGLRYNDPKLGIDWPLEPTVISEKDKKHPLINQSFVGITI